MRIALLEIRKKREGETMGKKIKPLGFLIALTLSVITPQVWAEATGPDTTAGKTKAAQKVKKAKKPKAVATAAATPTAPSLTVGGLVDAYFTYNLTNAAATLAGAGNNGTYFNNADNSFSLGLAEVILAAAQGPGSGRLVLAYGQEGNLGLVSSGVNGIDVLQAYVSYALDKWTFSLGRMATHMGNEVIESKSNWNYSRSLLFWYTIPLWHNGLCVNFAPTAPFGVTAYVYNGWNNAFATNNSMEKSFGLQAVIKPAESTVSFVVNGIIGPNPFNATDGNPHFVFEGIVNWAATSAFSLAMDFEYGSQGLGSDSTPSLATFWGMALYGRYQFEDGWALALRLEEVMDDEGMLGLYGAIPAASATDVEGREATLTIEKALTLNTLLRLEMRCDGALSGGAGYSTTTIPTGPFAGGNGNQFTTTGSMVFSF
jgi:hypothetical protein